MDKNKDIFQQIKDETLERPSANFTYEIIQRAGIKAKVEPWKSGFLSNLLYGGASIITGCVILAMVVTNLESYVSPRTEQAGKNLISLTKQVEAGFKELINTKS